jgi:uncharacterized protein YkwD
MRRTLTIIITIVVGFLVPAAILPMSTSAQSSEPAALYQVFLPMVTEPASTSSPAGQAIVNEVLALVNTERASVGCSALALNAKLMTAAQGHSEDMALRNYVEHDSPDGVTPSQRVTNAGYDWSKTGENIAAGQPTAAEVMSAWMNSPGHRANILDCGYTEIGIGYMYESNDTYQHYWTQNFGTPW